MLIATAAKVEALRVDFNATVFDRAAARLRLEDVRRLEADDPVVAEAGDFLGLTT